jgi:hypothetical protein
MPVAVLRYLVVAEAQSLPQMVHEAGQTLVEKLWPEK